MLFFRKNKRKFAHRSHRKVFVAMFLLAFVSTLIALPLIKANAADVPVASVEFFSENSDYENGDPGAWKITKSAEWTGVGKAQVKFEIETNSMHDTEIIRDAVIIMDNSLSMEGTKIRQVKSDAESLVKALLEEQAENQVALVSFNSTATVISGFSRDQAALTAQIRALGVDGQTNYYDAFLKAEDVLDGYVQQPGHELLILFLTDGDPNVDTPNEVAEYYKIKAMYPDSIIDGIQYEMGDVIRAPIIRVSDHQFVANINTLNNVLFRAAFDPHVYEQFILYDFINDEFWAITDESSIHTAVGTTCLFYNGDTPVVGWHLDGVLYSGQRVTLTIDIELKEGYLGLPEQLFPTNRGEEIITSIDGAPDEDVDSDLKPILREINPVIYDPNAPSGCDVAGTVPETVSYPVFSAVEISDNKLTCQGYDFKGWQIATHGVTVVNDDVFIMPGNEVVFKAIWGKPAISKSLDGTPFNRAVAKFDVGIDVNTKIRTLSGEDVQDFRNQNTAITAFKRSDTLPSTIDITDDGNILSAADSDIPIYGWFDDNDGTIYFYSDSEYIFLNEDAHFMLISLSGLTNIDGLRGLITSKTKTLMGFFAAATVNLPNVDAVAGWDTSNVENMDGLFSASENYITDMSGLANWNTSKVTNLDSAFTGLMNITSLDFLAKWDTSKVENFASVFGGGWYLSDIDALANWNVSSAKTMNNMFESVGLVNVDALAGWDVSNVENMSYMFYDTLDLEDVSGIANWDVSNVKYASYMFFLTRGLSDIHGLGKWKFTNLLDASYMFGLSGITDLGELDDNGNVINGVKDWGMGKVQTMSNMFYYAYSLTNIDGAKNWDLSEVRDINYMFDNAWALESIDGAANWNTPLLMYASGTFRGASSLTSIEALRNWNVSNMIYMNETFSGATAIESLEPIFNWTMPDLQYMTDTFKSIPDEIQRPSWYVEPSGD